ncbi:MAG: glutathione peroxidase [Flavisolibacter sp.]|jgi:glutathione peroxidase
MTLRQKALQLIYPLLMKFGRKKERRILKNEQRQKPVHSFYDLSVQLNNDSYLKFNALKGRKILLVNTASNCGYTAQYAELQKLYEAHKEKLTIIGFPSNDFKEQEKGSDSEIAQFCQLNFGVNFPLAKKSTVVKSNHQHPVFQWLSHAEQNGWNDDGPTWNFSKFLVNEEGVLTHVFTTVVSPLSKEIVNAIQQ